MSKRNPKILETALDILQDIAKFREFKNTFMKKNIQGFKENTTYDKGLLQTTSENKREDKGKLNYWKRIRQKRIDLNEYTTENLFSVLIVYVLDPLFQQQSLQNLQKEFQESALTWLNFQNHHTMNSQLNQSIVKNLLKSICQELDKKDKEQATNTVINLIETYNIVELVLQIFLRTLCRNRCDHKKNPKLLTSIESFDMNIDILSILELLSVPLRFKVNVDSQQSIFSLTSNENNNNNTLKIQYHHEKNNKFLRVSRMNN